MLAALPAAAEIPADVTTARNAILCLDRDNVAVANQPAVFRSQTVLRAMGCIRVGAGIPHAVAGSRVLRRAGSCPLLSGRCRRRFGIVGTALVVPA
jgi:hypothetical protein